MDAHATESETGLSEFETAWFGELRRMKREVGLREGAGNGEKADSRSLWARTNLVSAELLSLPALFLNGADNESTAPPQLAQTRNRGNQQKDLERRLPRRSGQGSIPGLGTGQRPSLPTLIHTTSACRSGIFPRPSSASEGTEWNRGPKSPLCASRVDPDRDQHGEGEGCTSRSRNLLA